MDLPELLEECLAGAQDDQSALGGSEEEQVKQLILLLQQNEISSLQQLKEKLEPCADK
ncbi:MAG: hypothetical protein GF334_02430 [Candidatus Altiarchaeales archaeon]|nr:hypothetical protein [Candidatus Altiarchaeales archaeon]